MGMRSALAYVVIALMCLLACAQETKGTPAGPAVPDQLRSRGYITTPKDTMIVRDSTRFMQDSLRR
jgi:hypothetical protein